MQPAEQEAIRTLVERLCRPHRSGGDVIERAAIVAAGPDSEAILAWVTAHDGRPEDLGARNADRGLHGARLSSSGGSDNRPPLRYVLPPGALEPNAG
ncbi:MAG: hypothetical protein ACR2HC_02105 [Thermoleophilaceae bacterium]